MKLGTGSSWGNWLATGMIAAGIVCNTGCEKPAASKAQRFQLSKNLLSAVPAAEQLVHSTNLVDRIALLNQLVTHCRNECVASSELRFELPRLDYISVARAVFTGGLRRKPDSAQTLDALGTISFVATTLNLTELGAEFVPFLKSSNSTVQYVALDAIAALKPPDAAAAVAKLLSEPEWPIGRKTVETLVALRAKEAIAPLALRLKSEHPSLRWATIKSMGTIGDPAAAPYLLSQLDDPDVYIRYWTRHTLGQLKAVRELRSALLNPSSAGDEAHALAWLAIAGDSEALTNVARCLLEDGRITPATMRGTLRQEPIDSTAMQEVLSKADAHMVWRHLGYWMQRGETPTGKKIDESAFREAAVLMGEYGSREAIPFLLEMVKPQRSHVSMAAGYSALYAAGDALGKLRAREAVPDLLAILTNQAPGTVLTADLVEIALSRIADRAAVPALLEWCRDPRRLMRGQILMNLSAAVDEHLSQRIENTSIRGLYQAPINVTAASVTAQSGLPIVLHYEPADGRSWPWANTSVQTISVRYALERILDALKPTGAEYTVVIKSGEVHVVTIEDGIAELAKALRP